MRSFVRQSILFLAPFLAYAGLVVAVDPYEYFGVSRMIPAQVKERTSAKFNTRLWELLAYRRHPLPDILLGDSRMRAMKPEVMRELTGREYANLSYGGGTLPEVISTFWIADSLTRLRSVTIGLGLSQMSARSNFDQTRDYVTMTANPGMYFVSRLVAKGIAYNLYYAITGRDPKIGKPPMSRERFWQFQLQTTVREGFAGFRYSDRFMDDLRKVSERCRARGIRLEFVILPSHRDLQQRVESLGLAGDLLRLKRDLALLGTVHDYETVGPLTLDRGNFEDPYHFREHVVRRIVKDVWATIPPPSGASPVDEEPASLRR